MLDQPGRSDGGKRRRSYAQGGKPLLADWYDIVALQHLPLVRSDWGARHPAGEADKKPCGAIGNSQKTGIAIGRLGDPVVDFGHGHDLWSAQFIYVAAVMCGIAGGDGDRLANTAC